MSIQKASLLDKEWVVDVIANAFQENRSVNWVIKNDDRIISRIKELIDYAFVKCSRSGGALVNSEKTGAVLYLNANSKTNLFLDLLSDLKLAVNTIGLARAIKVLKRERYIHQFHPKEPFIYLWFIGVIRSEQGKGTGRTILEEVCQLADESEVAIYLETSEKSTLSFYERSKFVIHHKWDTEFLGFPLWFLKREPQ